jgi:uncharacterized protein
MAPARRRRGGKKKGGGPPVVQETHTSLPTGRAAYADTRVWLLKEHGPVCAYCGLTFPAKVLTLDHVTPRRGRSAYDRRDNLVLACKDCNGKKADKPFLAWVLGNKARARHLYVYGQHLSVGILEILAPMVGTDVVFPVKQSPPKAVAPRAVFGPDDDDDVSPYIEDDPYRQDPAPAAAATRIRLEQRVSPRHGMGIFAVDPIPAHAAVIEYAGELISHKVAARRYPTKKRHAQPEHTFVLQLDDTRVIDANVGGNEARFINHSCEPNVDPIAVGDAMWLFAVRDIAPGEELGYDYAIELDEPHTPARKKSYPCHCGAPSCRGTLLRAKSARWPADVRETRKVIAARIRSAQDDE